MPGVGGASGSRDEEGEGDRGPDTGGVPTREAYEERQQGRGYV